MKHAMGERSNICFNGKIKLEFHEFIFLCINEQLNKNMESK